MDPYAAIYWPRHWLLALSLASGAVIGRPPYCAPRAITAFGKVGWFTRHPTLRASPYGGTYDIRLVGKRCTLGDPGRTLLDRSAYEFDR